MAEDSSAPSVTAVRILVAGDAKTGKSSLIVTAASGNFPIDIPTSVLPPTSLSEDLFPDRVPVTLVDSSSSPEYRDRLVEELKKADAVVLTYASDRPETLNRLGTYWLPELRRLEVKVPILLASCMVDKKGDEEPFNDEQVIHPLCNKFQEVEGFIECSAVNNSQVYHVFSFAKKAALYPIGPLMDHELHMLKPQCQKALKRIFTLCDHDKDGSLSDEELNGFQLKCFKNALGPSEILEVRRVVQERFMEGFNEQGLTLTGFLYLHRLFLDGERVEAVWTVLREFGYNNDLRLRDDQLPPPIKRYPDQSVEITFEAVEFLKKIFSTHDVDSDGVLQSSELDNMFSTAPENPWNEAPYCNASETTNPLGGLSLDGFLSQWGLMTLLDPIRTMETLKYIGYESDLSSAIHITRRRRLDRKKKQTDRSVLQCFVFGPKGSGKSALLNSFVKRPFKEDHVPTSDDQYAINVVDQPSSSLKKKILILREIPEEGVKKLLSRNDALASCDVAVFVHDRSSEHSRKKATEMLTEVASHGEATGYEVPCLIVSAKEDLVPYLTEIQDSTRVSQDMGIEAPIPLSTKLGDICNVFHRIVKAADQPHLSLPETPARKTRKKYKKLVKRSLLLVSVGSAAAVAYRVYAARKAASG